MDKTCIEAIPAINIAKSGGLMTQITDMSAEEDFRTRLLNNLPPVIAREAVADKLGGLVAPKTLANADSAGKGPMGAYQFGRKVVYPRESLIDWIITRFGVEYLKANLKEQL